MQYRNFEKLRNVYQKVDQISLWFSSLLFYWEKRTWSAHEVSIYLSKMVLRLFGILQIQLVQNAAAWILPEARVQYNEPDVLVVTFS